MVEVQVALSNLQASWTGCVYRNYYLVRVAFNCNFSTCKCRS